MIKYNKIYFSIIFIFFFIQYFFTQSFSYKEPPLWLKKATISNLNYTLPSNVIYIETKLPKSYSKAGNVDYTKIIQAVLNEYDFVVFPDFPVLINDNGLYLKSNSKIYFQKNSKIITTPSIAEKKDLENIKNWYDIIRVYNKKNIEIFGANIVGDRKQHKGNKGEWGAGIAIKNSENIKIYNAKISNTWGDGIFVGSEDGGISKNIYIYNSIIDEARRNGISITSGLNVYVDSTLISNTHGTDPSCGIDIEPSWYKDIIENINLTNIYTYNNANTGIAINTNAFSSNERDYKKYISIRILRHKDYQSNVSFGYSIDALNTKYKPKGNIIYKDSYSENPRWNYYWKTPQNKSIIYSVQNFNGVKGNSKKTINDENF